MTVPSTTSATSFQGTGTTAVYPFTWEIAQVADLVLYELVVATGVITPLTLNVDYSVSGVLIQTGGTVTLTAGNLPTGTTLFIGSDPLEVQALLLQQGANYNPADVMNALDLLTRQMQATRRVANNGIQIPLVESLAGFTTTLPAAAVRKLLWTGFDINGNVIVGNPSGTNLPAGAIIQQVANVAALRLFTSPINGYMVQTQGYSAPDDGGQALYIWNGTDTRADNSGTILQVTGIATGRWNLQYSGAINVKWFGAKGDGATNDYAAMVAAEVWAYANGASIYLPDATFAVTCSSAGLGFRVSVYTGAAIIKLTGSYVSDAYTVTNKVGASYGTNITFQGLTVNANNLARGLYLTNATEVAVIGCTFQNCLTNGVGVYTSTGVQVNHCQVSGVAYVTIGGSFQAADGISFFSSPNCVAFGNTIQNFQRIGIVSDQAGSGPSSGTRVINNTIFNANNCGNSLTEYNAGIWFETTNGGQIIGNRISNIGGNAGQSSGRVIGMTINGGADTVAEAIIVQGNRISVHTGSATPLYAGVLMEGAANYGKIIMEGNWIADCGTPVAIEAGLDEIIIRDLVCNNVYWNANAYGNAIIGVDNTGATFFNNLTIDRVTVTNLTDADATNTSAHLFFISQSGWNSNVHISNVDGWNIYNASGATLGRMFISNSVMAMGSGTAFGMLRGSEIYCTNVKWGVYASRAILGFIYANFVAMKAVFSNCIFDGNAGSVWSAVASLALDVTFNGCHFYNGFGMLFGGISGTTNVRVNGCLVSQFNTSQGFFNTTGQTSASFRVMFRNNDFINSSNVAAVQAGGAQPTKSIFDYNSRAGSMTAVHNYSAPTQDVGEVAA